MPFSQVINRAGGRLGGTRILIYLLGGSLIAGPSVWTASLAGQTPPESSARSVTAEVAAGIGARLRFASDLLPGSLTGREQDDLVGLYRGKNEPLWVDAVGRPTRNAFDALFLLENAEADGLVPDDYSASSLRQQATSLQRAVAASAAEISTFDVSSSAAILRYFYDLHLGRIDPQTLGFRLTIPSDEHDFVTLLRSALDEETLIQTAAMITPPFAQYRDLRAMLARYSSLATDTEPLPAFAGTVRPGDTYAGARVLSRRLIALGDLDLPTPVSSDIYDGPLVEAVRRFQARHVLDVDGIVGRATYSALDVPLAWRVRQIELALERLRWLPDVGEQRLLALNIPMFQLWGWDSPTSTAEPLFSMRAVVGRALRTETPVFVENMRSVIFRPYWNVPRSILRDEMLPLLRRDLDYLRRHDMEMVRGPGDDATPVAATPENLALLERGLLRLRQRPGPENALGLVKFVIPNDENVYLHGTPQQALFARTRRDFSHGCVRVEDPVALAEWALQDQPEWTRRRILEAMSGDRPRHVTLTHPIQVILFYLTAVVMPQDGTMHFADDIYGHDARLDRALARHRE
jgi:L,D-transpeptidase YcbB